MVFVCWVNLRFGRDVSSSTVIVNITSVTKRYSIVPQVFIIAPLLSVIFTVNTMIIQVMHNWSG